MTSPDVTTTPRSNRLLELTAPRTLELPWLKLTLAALAIAAVWTATTDGTPTYDPWAWIIWGREIIEGDLVTTTGPSWKPLPMFFTVPFALFGEAAPDLWLWIGRATSLLALAAVAQLGCRIGGRLTAALAVVALATTPLYYAYGINGSSEGMLVLCCALATTAWLDGRRTPAFWWLVAAALLRPEVWFFVALLGLERLRGDWRRIWWVGGAGLFTVACWFVPEKIGAGSWTRAATRANAPNPDSAAFADSPTLEVLGSMGDLMLWVPAVGIVLAAVVGAGALLRGRRAGGEAAASADGASRVIASRPLRAAAAFALLALIWVAIVAAMTEGGYAGNPRYLVAPLGLLLPVGIAGIVWVTRLLVARGAVLAGELVVMAAVVALAVAAADRLPSRAADNAYQAANRVQLRELVDRPGVARAIAACGPVVTHPLLIPPVAWTLERHVDEIDFLSVDPVSLREEPAPRRATFIVGGNVEDRAGRRAPARPLRVPEGASELARSGQLAIYQNC